MPSKVKITGFAGTDCYDLIMYLAKLLTASSKKVLLVDNSCNKALSRCIPAIDMASGSNKEICYEDFVIRKDALLDSLEGEYDYILMDFGQNINHKDIRVCDNVFLVTDTGLHNIAALESFKAIEDNTYLLIREIPNGMDEKYMLKLLKEKGIQEKKSYYFYFDEADKEAMTALQYCSSFHYKNLSPAILYFLREVLLEVFEIEEKRMKLAEKKLRRRR